MIRSSFKAKKHTFYNSVREISKPVQLLSNNIQTLAITFKLPSNDKHCSKMYSLLNTNDDIKICSFKLTP